MLRTKFFHMGVDVYSCVTCFWKDYCEQNRIVKQDCLQKDAENILKNKSKDLFL